MQLIINEKNKQRLIKIIDWLLYMLGYTIVFILVTSFFDSIYIDSNHLFLWAFLIILVIYILNKTVKPILVTLTIPITGLTLGLFYPCINVFILKLADWLLGAHFQTKNLYIIFFVAILLSITNFLMGELLKKIIKKVKQWTK